MDRCVTSKDKMYREVRDIYESVYCFNVGGYRDALCKIGNEMHSDYRCSHSRLAHTSAVRTAAKFPFYCRLLLANNKDTSPAVPMATALGWAIIGLGLEFF